MVCYSLDVNISRQSNATEIRLFHLAVLTIDYYWPIRLFTQTKSLFVWLNGLSLLIDPSINLNRTKSESFSKNYDINRVVNKIYKRKKILLSKFNCTKSKSNYDICSKNYCNIGNKMAFKSFCQTIPKVLLKILI